MIQFQKWDYSPNLTGQQVWSAIFKKTIEGEGADVAITTAYSPDQLENYLGCSVLEEEARDAMMKAVADFRGEPVQVVVAALPRNVVLLRAA